MSKLITFLGIVLAGLLIVGAPAIQAKLHITPFTVPDNIIGGLFVALVFLLIVRWLTAGIGKKAGK